MQGVRALALCGENPRVLTEVIELGSRAAANGSLTSASITGSVDVTIGGIGGDQAPVKTTLMSTRILLSAGFDMQVGRATVLSRRVDPWPAQQADAASENVVLYSTAEI